MATDEMSEETPTVSVQNTRNSRGKKDNPVRPPAILSARPQNNKRVVAEKDTNAATPAKQQKVASADESKVPAQVKRGKKIGQSKRLIKSSRAQFVLSSSMERKAAKAKKKRTSLLKLRMIQ